MDYEQTGLSLGQVLGILRRRAPWILLCFVLFAGGAYGYSKHKVKKYTATAALSFSDSQIGQQIAGLSVTSNSNPLAQQASNIELVKTGDGVAAVARLLGRGLTAEMISSSLSVGGKTESSIVAVSATWTSPTLAAAIANTYARQFVKEQQSVNHRLFKSALALVNRQLAALTPSQRFGTDGLDLQDRAHTLGLLAELDDSNVQVAQEAFVPSSPSSPKTKRNTLLGAILGLFLGLGIAFLLERFDRRIRGSEELEAIYRLPLLGAVPNSAALSGTALPPIEAEAFSLIRAHLRFFSVDREVRTVVITSPAAGDGKTTIARHLAEAAARLGSRVLLLEVDLRHPTLARQLDIESGPGLADLLIGAVSIGEATRSIDLHAKHTLDVLAAGIVPPPNPGELLESQAMGAVLERARSVYDLVVIDTPPLTAVSDAFPLLTNVDGVVIVGRIGRSRRDAAEELQRVLASSGTPLLGIIVNGAKSGLPSPYPATGQSSPADAPVKDDSASEDLVSTTAKSS